MEGLGIDPLLIGVQIVNFGLLLFILKKVLYKPMLTTLKARQDKLSEIEKDRQTVTKDKEVFEKKQEELLATLQKERKTIIAEAKKQAELDKKEVLSDAQKKAKEIISKATMEAQNIQKEAENSLEKKALEMAEVMTEKVIAQVLVGETQKLTIDTAVKKLNSIKI